MEYIQSSLSYRVKTRRYSLIRRKKRLTSFRRLYCRHLVFFAPFPCLPSENGLLLAGSTEKLKWDRYTSIFNHVKKDVEHRQIINFDFPPMLWKISLILSYCCWVISKFIISARQQLFYNIYVNAPWNDRCDKTRSPNTGQI